MWVLWNIGWCSFSKSSYIVNSFQWFSCHRNLVFNSQLLLSNYCVQVQIHVLQLIQLLRGYFNIHYTHNNGYWLASVNGFIALHFRWPNCHPTFYNFHINNEQPLLINQSNATLLKVDRWQKQISMAFLLFTIFWKYYLLLFSYETLKPDQPPFVFSNKSVMPTQACEHPVNELTRAEPYLWWYLMMWQCDVDGKPNWRKNHANKATCPIGFWTTHARNGVTDQISRLLRMNPDCLVAVQ